MLDMFISPKTLSNMKCLTIRQFLLQIVNAGYSMISTYMLWKFIGILLDNDSPIVVVLTESMYPGFERGDILFLSPKKYKDYHVNDMTVFQLRKNDIPIVHRVIKRFGDRILTKGDNNNQDDVGLYRKNQFYLSEPDVISRVVGRLPYAGMITIWINTIPSLKFIIMALMGIGVLLTREE